MFRNRSAMELLRLGRRPRRLRFSIWSPELDREVTIRVQVPRPTEPGQTFPVIYAQDGQHLFRSRLRRRTWRAGDALKRMSQLGRDAILVGIDNNGALRAEEYSPFEDERFGGGRADDYVRFLTDTLKPYIDAHLPTSPAPDDTAIMGSSLGGLAALYAKFTRPDIFGSAAALSPSVSFADGSLGRFIESQRASGRVYVDVGTHEFGESSGEYVRRVRELRDQLLSIGFQPGTTLEYQEVLGGRHTESSWGQRLPEVFSHLLPVPARSWAPLEYRRPWASVWMRFLSRA